MGTVIFLLTLLILCLIVVSTIRAFRRPAGASDRMAEAADLLGFEHRVDALNLFPSIAGRRADRSAKVTVDYPNNDDPSTVYEIEHRSGDVPPFVLRSRAWTDRFTRSPDGMSELRLGDAALDKSIRTYGVDHDALTAYLSPVRREVIVALIDRWQRIEVRNELVVVRSGRGVPKDPAQIVSNIDELIAVTEILER